MPPEGRTDTCRAWPGFLRGESAQEIRARLAENDPLRLREASARRLREVWRLLEPDRVFERAAAVCAEAALDEAMPEDLAVWSLAKIDVAIEQLVTRDHEAQRTRPEDLDEEEKEFPLLVECLMLEPGLVRKVSVEFNALEPLPRRAFFELMVEGREVGECIEAGPWDEDGLYEAIQTAMAVFGMEARVEESEDVCARSKPARPRASATRRSKTHVEPRPEDLAEVLRQASVLAYWRAPLFAYMPVDDEGRPFDPTTKERSWRRRAQSILRRTTERSRRVELLRASLERLEPRMAFPLARAAVSLVPSDRNRFLAAFMVPWDKPRTAIALLEPQVRSAQSSRDRSEVSLALGGRLCSLGMLSEARIRYREATALGNVWHGRLNAFHLSCCLRDEEGALTEADGFRDLPRTSMDILESIAIFGHWSRTRPIAEAEATRSFVERISKRLPEPALALFDAYPS